MNRCGWLLLAIGCMTPLGLAAPAGEKATESPLVVVDAQGKEVNLKTWRLTAGVRRLPVGNGKVSFLEFRDAHSTTYQAGILTLIPITSLRRVDYDYDKKTVTAVVATAGKDTTLTGTTKFVGINRLAIEGDADLGELGFASVKFQGGNPKAGISGVRLGMPEPLAELKLGQDVVTAVILGDDKEKTRHEIAEPSVLYQLSDGTARLASQLYFKKTVKVDLAKIATLRHVEPEDKKQTSTDFELTLQSGEKHTLTLLTKVELEGAKGATLAGVFGRVAVGYQLFPAHTIAELRMEQPKK
jgi:hypothetical protein